jgi:signal transduction histidine kinase
MSKTLATSLKQNNWFQMLWETANNPLFILDENGVIQECNSLAEALTEAKEGIPFASLFVETQDIHQVLETCQTKNEMIRLDSLTLSNPNLTASGLCVFPVNEDEHQFFLASLKTFSHDLNALEETARSNDARLQKLSNQLTTVSNELLVKTLQLAEEKNKLSTVINGISEGLIGCDQEGHIIHCNQSANELLNLGEEEVQTQTFQDLNPEIAVAIGYKPNEPESIIKSPVDITYGAKEIQITPSLISDKNQVPIGFVLILRDRTKEAELDRMKSDLISIVSHELRSPLTSIKGYVDLMTGGDLGEIPQTMQSYLHIVSANANRLSALIDDMLDLSRIESGKLSMSFGKVDVKYLCDYVFLTMKPQAEQKKIHFSQNVPSGLAVSGDVDRLQQVLTNLVSNAIKYTPENGTVQIEASRQQETIQIKVCDSGIGISEEDQKKLFQKFFRVKNEKTRNIGGTGLGLCIAKSIVEAHEGAIQVESKEEKGSCFVIELLEYHP